MKGILLNTEKGWLVSYKDDEGGTYIIDVEPGRIDELNAVGTHLQVNSEVDFVMKETHSFPYRYAVPIVNPNGLFDESQRTSTMYAPTKRTKKQFKITLWLVGFPTDEVEVICDAYDSNTSGGYWYFYDEVNGKRNYLCSYPISRTAFHEIETIETEY